MKCRALAVAIVAATTVSVAVAWPGHGHPSAFPARSPAAAGQFGFLLDLCRCQAELTRLTEANARVTALRDRLADLTRQIADNQASQDTARADLKALREQFDKHLGGGVGSNSGTFVSGDDGREVRYNAQGQIETFQNGKPVPGSAKPSPFMTGLRSKIDDAEAALKKSQDEAARLEKERQQVESDLAQAMKDAEAAAAAFKACLERCQESQAGSTTQPSSAAAAPSTAPTGSGQATGSAQQSATTPGGVTQATTGSGSSAANLNWALDDRISLRLGLRYELPKNFGATPSPQPGAAGAQGAGAPGAPADVAPSDQPTSWADWRQENPFHIGDTLEQRLAFWSRFTQPESPAGGTAGYADDPRPEATLGGPIVRDRLWIWGSYGTQGGFDAVPAETGSSRYSATLGGPMLRDRLWFFGRAPDGGSPTSDYRGLFQDDARDFANRTSFFDQESLENPTASRLEDTHLFSSNFYLTGLYSIVDGGFQLTPQMPAPETRVDDNSWENSFQLYQTERPQEQYRQDASGFFNTGNLSHELKFGASYRQADVQSLSTWGGGSLLPSSSLNRRFTNNWQLYGTPDGFGGSSPRSDYYTGFGSELDDIPPRLGLTYTLGAERKTLLRGSYSRFADQLGSGAVGSLMTSPGYLYGPAHPQAPVDNYLGGAARGLSGFELNEIPPRLSPTYDAPERDLLLNDFYGRYVDQLASGGSGVGSINSFNFFYFYYPDDSGAGTRQEPYSYPEQNPWDSYPVQRFDARAFRTDSLFLNDERPLNLQPGRRYDLPEIGTNPTSAIVAERALYYPGSGTNLFILNDPNTLKNAQLSGQPADDRYQLFIIVYVNGQVASRIRIAENPDDTRPFTLASAARSARELFASWFGFAPLQTSSALPRAISARSLAPGTLVRVSPAQGQQGGQAGQGARGPAVSLVATGASSGDAFNIQVVDPSGEPVRVVAPDGLVLQPIRQTGNRAATQAPAAAAADPASKVVGYCLEYLKPPPPKDALYQVAPDALQQKYAPMRRILEAGRALVEQGLLKPDSDPAAYATFIQQWALWTKLENWNFSEFAREFVDRTRKNVENMGRQWTPAMDAALKTAAPNRFNDIMAVLLEAETLRRNETPAP